MIGRSCCLGCIGGSEHILLQRRDQLISLCVCVFVPHSGLSSLFCIQLLVLCKCCLPVAFFPSLDFSPYLLFFPKKKVVDRAINGVQFQGWKNQ